MIEQQIRNQELGEIDTRISTDQSLSTDQSSSQLPSSESQHRESDEEINEQIWYQRLKYSKLPIQKDAMGCESRSPTKPVLKREASPHLIDDEDFLLARNKKIRIEVKKIDDMHLKKGEGQRRGEEGEIAKTKEVEGIEMKVDKAEKREGEGDEMVYSEHFTVDLQGQWADSPPPSETEDRSKNPRNKKSLIECGKDETRLSSITLEGVGSRSQAFQSNQPPPDPPGLTPLRDTPTLSFSALQEGASSGRQLVGHLPLHIPYDSDEEWDSDTLTEATVCALGINGKSWWNVELESAKPKWRYRREAEL